MFGQEYMYQNSDMDWDHMDLNALLEHTRHIYTRIITQRAKLITITCSFLLCSCALHVALSIYDKLKSSLRTFDGRHHDLVVRYGKSVSQMTTDVFLLS
jgi:hypothetical protein